MKKYLLALIAIMGITYTSNSFGFQEYSFTLKNDTNVGLTVELKPEDKNIPYAHSTFVRAHQEYKWNISRKDLKCFKMEIVIVAPYKRIQLDFYNRQDQNVGDITCKPSKITITKTEDGKYRAVVGKQNK